MRAITVSSVSLNVISLSIGTGYNRPARHTLPSLGVIPIAVARISEKIAPRFFVVRAITVGSVGLNVISLSICTGYNWPVRYTLACVRVYPVVGDRALGESGEDQGRTDGDQDSQPTHGALNRQ